jgi:hypothetical protein
MRYFVTFLAGMLLMLFLAGLVDYRRNGAFRYPSDRNQLQKCWHKHSGMAERFECRKLQMDFLLEKL